MTRVPEPRVLAADRSSASTSSPARSTKVAGQFARAAASTRSSPSAVNRPSFSRQRLSRSLRIVLSLSLSADRITNKKGASSGARESRFPWSALGGHGLPGFLGKTSKGLGVAHGYVGQNLAVDLDAGLLEAVHELAVGESLLAGGGVDAHDPKAAEVALLVATVPVGVRV